MELSVKPQITVMETAAVVSEATCYSVLWYPNGRSKVLGIITMRNRSRKPLGYLWKSPTGSSHVSHNPLFGWISGRSSIQVVLECGPRWNDPDISEFSLVFGKCEGVSVDYSVYDVLRYRNSRVLQDSEIKFRLQKFQPTYLLLSRMQSTRPLGEGEEDSDKNGLEWYLKRLDESADLSLKPGYDAHSLNVFKVLFGWRNQDFHGVDRTVVSECLKNHPSKSEIEFSAASGVVRKEIDNGRLDVNKMVL